MRDAWRMMGAMAAGAGLLYFLDPQTGARRRNVVRDKTASLGRRAARMTGKAGRDLRNRVQGRLAALQHGFGSDSPAPHQLSERVRIT